MADSHSIAGLRPGLRVMISAGAAGIGRVMVESFLRAGAKVHYCDIDPKAIEACGIACPQARGHVCDMADEAAINRWFDVALDELGGLDVMVNNAGIAGPTALLEDIGSEDWRRTVDVNLNSMFYASKRAIPALKAAAKEHGDAAMINLSSTAGRLSFPLRTPYAATKWAVVGLTKALAQEVGPVGVRVNAIQPGPVAGDRIERVLQAKADAAGVDIEVTREHHLQDLGLRHFVEPQDIADMALFLSSPQARSVAGQALSVCADMIKMP